MHRNTMEACWDDSSTLSQRLKIERTLNFTTMPQEEEDFEFSRKKVSRDPMSHRIIEKRRRDRMNNCLADLSRLIPIVYLKKGRGRIEKTEIIEMATKHLRHLQGHPCKDPATCEIVQNLEAQDSHKQHRMGFQECTSEMVRFLVETEGFYPNEGVCLRLINHLHEHYEKLIRAGCYGQNRTPKPEDINVMQMEVESLSATKSDCNQSSTSAATAASTSTSNKRSITPYSEQHSRDSALTSYQLDSVVENRKVFLESSVDKHFSIENEADFCLEPDHQHHSSCHVEESSQLRNILKCPPLPQKRMRSNSNSSSLSNASSYCHNRPSINATPCCLNSDSILPNAADVLYANRVEEVYKFKNNIKERFNADISHHHIDHHRIKIIDENVKTVQCRDSNNLTVESRTASTGFEFPTLFSSPTSGFTKTNRLARVKMGQGNSTTIRKNVNCKEMEELNIKVSETVSCNVATVVNSSLKRNSADAQIDSSSSNSSCGSNQSPGNHFNGGGSSSSGYSTAGERPATPKQMKCEIQTGPQSPIAYSPSPKQIMRTLVPVFALHPRGNFYIPLTLDAAVLAPFFVDSDSESISATLHPVSISVNFCRRLKMTDINSVSVNNLWPKNSTYVY